MRSFVFFSTLARTLLIRFHKSSWSLVSVYHLLVQLDFEALRRYVHLNPLWVMKSRKGGEVWSKLITWQSKESLPVFCLKLAWSFPPCLSGAPYVSCLVWRKTSTTMWGYLDFHQSLSIRAVQLLALTFPPSICESCENLLDHFWGWQHSPQTCLLQWLCYPFQMLLYGLTP